MFLDDDASGVGAGSCRIEVGCILPDEQSFRSLARPSEDGPQRDQIAEGVPHIMRGVLIGTDALFARGIHPRHMMAVPRRIGLLLLGTFTGARWLRGSGRLPLGTLPSLPWLFPAFFITARIASARACSRH